MDDLFYCSPEPDHRDLSAIRFLAVQAGLRVRVVRDMADASGPCIYHSAGPREDDAAVTHHALIAMQKDRSQLLWSDLLDGAKYSSLVSESHVNFDVIGAVARLLSDEVNADVDKRSHDSHGRLTYKASYQASQRLGPLPIVNLYVAFFLWLVSAVLRMPIRARWSEGKRAAIVLTHDVDWPLKYAMLQTFWKGRPSPRTLAARSASAVHNLGRRLVDPHPDDFWQFEEILGLEARLGVRSSFYFAAVTRFAESASRYDVLYEIGSQRFLRLFDRLRVDDVEIGLHAGYEAYRSVARLRAQKQYLEACAGTEVIGLRHHYWHLGADIEATLAMHESAGFRYDSSLAFNDHLGYRRNVALPFHPWLSGPSRDCATLQIPTFCMDGNLFYSANRVDDAVAEVMKYVEAIKAYGGVAAIDWHSHTSIPGERRFRAWGSAYVELLNILAKDPDLWLTDARTVWRWETQREQALIASDEVA